MVHGGTWWYMVVHGGTWWYMVVHGGRWWHMVAHGGTWNFQTLSGSVQHYSIISSNYQALSKVSRHIQTMQVRLGSLGRPDSRRRKDMKLTCLSMIQLQRHAKTIVFSPRCIHLHLTSAYICISHHKSAYIAWFRVVCCLSN